MCLSQVVHKKFMEEVSMILSMIEAQKRMNENNGDLDLHGMPGFEQTCSSSLPGFEWELCLLYPNTHSEQTALEWICQRFSQVYSRQNFTR